MVRSSAVKDVFFAKASPRRCAQSFVSSLSLVIERVTLSFLASLTLRNNDVSETGLSTGTSMALHDSSGTTSKSRGSRTLSRTFMPFPDSPRRTVSVPDVNSPQISTVREDSAFCRFTFVAKQLATTSVNLPCTLKVRLVRGARAKTSQRASAPSQLS